MTFVGLYNSRAQQIINCNEKLRHLSKEAAEFWIDQRGDNHRLKKPPALAVYQCDVCNGWHITSHPHRSNKPSNISELEGG